VLELKKKSAAGVALVNKLSSDQASLGMSMEEAKASELLEFETLRATCKELKTKASH
jgi:hypothetical protein